MTFLSCVSEELPKGLSKEGVVEDDNGLPKKTTLAGYEQQAMAEMHGSPSI